MMCLGWSTKEDCSGRPAQQITTPSACPNISWFWIGVAAIGAGLIFAPAGGRRDVEALLK